MSFSIKIVDNDTGKVLIDRTDAKAILGAFGNDETVCCMGYTACNTATLYGTFGGVQQILVKVSEDHPELNILANIEDFMKKRRGEI